MHFLEDVAHTLTAVQNALLGRPSAAAPVPERDTISNPPSLSAANAGRSDHMTATRSLGRSTAPMPATNLQVKSRLDKGKFDLLDDTDDDLEEVPKSEVERLFPSAQRSSTTKLKSISNHSSRETGEARLLGHTEPQPEDATVISIPTRSAREMSFKQGRSPFLNRGGLQPINTLSGEKPGTRSQYIQQRTVDLRQVVQSPQSNATKATIISKPISVIPAQEGPPRKKARTVSPAKSVPENSTRGSSSANGKFQHRSQASIGTMFGKDESDIWAERGHKANVKHNPLRNLHETTEIRHDYRHEVSSDDLMDIEDSSSSDTQKRRRNSKRSAEDQNGNPVEQPSSRRPRSVQQFEECWDKSESVRAQRTQQNRTPKLSKIQQRLANESPDVLQKGHSSPLPTTSGRKALLSSPDPPKPQAIIYPLRTFACENFVVAPNSTLELYGKLKTFRIRYKEREIGEDFLIAHMPLNKIKRIIIPEDDQSSITEIHLPRDVLPHHLCYFEFESEKGMTEFSLKLQELEDTVVVKYKDSQYLKTVLTRVSVATSTNRHQSRLNAQHSNSGETTSPSSARGDHFEQKRQRKVDSLDAPPEKILDKQRHVSSTRSNPRAVEHRQNDTLTAPEVVTTQSSTRRTRSRAEPSTKERSESPINLEPRRTGPPWETPLLYPATGKRSIVTWDDLSKLEDKEYLNDSIVDLFMRYLQNQVDPEVLKKIHFFSTFFYERLTKAGKRQIDYEAVKNWTKTTNILKRDYIVIPICENAHWYVMIVCNPRALCEDELKEDSEVEDTIAATTLHSEDSSPADSKMILESDLTRGDKDDNIIIDSDEEKTSSTKRKKSGRKSHSHTRRKYDTHEPVIITLDSLDIPRSTTAGLIKDYLIQEGKTHGKDIEKRSISGMSAKGIPHQPNWYDCGVYLCMYLEQFMADPQRFVTSLLRREDGIRWPQRLRSSILRDRLYDVLVELHKAQENPSHRPRIAPLSQILIKGEDFQLPPVTTRQTARAEEKDRETDRLKLGLDHYEKYRNRREAERAADIVQEAIPGANRAHQQAVDSQPHLTSRRMTAQKTDTIADDEDEIHGRIDHYAQNCGLVANIWHAWEDGFTVNDETQLRPYDLQMVKTLKKKMESGRDTIDVALRDGRTCKAKLVTHGKPFGHQNYRLRHHKDDQSAHRPQNTTQDDPAQMAMRLRHERSPVTDSKRSPTRARASEQVTQVDLTTPTQESEEHREVRESSITTDFLEGDSSYQVPNTAQQAQVQQPEAHTDDDVEMEDLNQHHEVIASRYFEDKQNSNVLSPIKRERSTKAIRLTEDWPSLSEDGTSIDI